MNNETSALHGSEIIAGMFADSRRTKKSHNRRGNPMIHFWLIMDDKGRFWDGTQWQSRLTACCAFMASLFDQDEMLRSIRWLQDHIEDCPSVFLINTTVEEVLPVAEVPAPIKTQTAKGGNG